MGSHISIWLGPPRIHRIMTEGFRLAGVPTTAARASDRARARELLQRALMQARAETTPADRLEELGLVHRRASPADRRIREAVITPQGKVAAEAVDVARQRMAVTLFKRWSRDDFDQLLRLMRMLADGLNETRAAE